MAHSTVVQGNYIVVFGGYNSQENSFLHANLNLLSLTGCTDYILANKFTIDMAYQEIIRTLDSEKLKNKTLHVKREGSRGGKLSHPNSAKINQETEKRSYKKNGGANEKNQKSRDDFKDEIKVRGR